MIHHCRVHLILFSEVEVKSSLYTDAFGTGMESDVSLLDGPEVKVGVLETEARSRIIAGMYRSENRLKRLGWEVLVVLGVSTEEADRS